MTKTGPSIWLSARLASSSACSDDLAAAASATTRRPPRPADAQCLWRHVLLGAGRTGPMERRCAGSGAAAHEVESAAAASSESARDSRSARRAGRPVAGPAHSFCVQDASAVACSVCAASIEGESSTNQFRKAMMERSRRLAVPLAVVVVGLVACALIIAAARPASPAALAGRGSRGSLSTQLRGVHKARLSMLDEECVSWRGCTGRYTPDTMDLNNPDTAYPDLGQGQSFYDRFDNYPNAWDASPAAAYVRTLYPGGYPAFAHEEPSVIVGGDTTKAYPFQVRLAPPCTGTVTCQPAVPDLAHQGGLWQDYGSSWGGGYDNYRTPYTYTY